MKPSHAELSFVVSPARLSSFISAIAFAAPNAPPSTFSKSLLSFSISSPELAKVKSDFEPTTPTKSNAVPKLSEEFLTCAKPSSNVKPFFFNSIKVFESPVPATEPFKPLFANAPKSADVSCIETPNALAAGAATLNDSTIVPKS